MRACVGMCVPVLVCEYMSVCLDCVCECIVCVSVYVLYMCVRQEEEEEVQG